MLLSKELKVLIVEDNDGDFILLGEYLTELAPDADITRCILFSETENFNPALFDVALIDLTLPDGDPGETVLKLKPIANQIPVIVLSGTLDIGYGVKSLQSGAQDFVNKDDLNSNMLLKSIYYSMERFRIRLELEQSEKKFRTLIENSLDGLMTISENKIVLDISPSVTRILGYSREEYIMADRTEFIHPDDRHIVNNAFDEALRHPEGIQNIQYRFKKKDGQYIWIESSFNNQLSETAVGAVILNFRDITARKLEEQRFRSLVQDGSDLIGILDESGAYKYVSPTVRPILGYRPEELIGVSAFSFIFEDDISLINQLLSSLESKHRMKLPPFRFRHRNGSWRWIETILTNLMEEPAVSGIVTNSRDVTEEMEKELLLTNALKRYDIVSKATSDTIWDWNLKTGDILWNKGIKGVFGFGNTSGKYNYAWKMSKVHPEERNLLEKSLNRHIALLTRKWEETYRFEAANGEYRYVQDRAFTVLNERNEPIRVIGSMQDITRRKTEENRLRLLESVISQSTDAVVITQISETSEYKVVYVNQAFTDITGISPEKVLQKGAGYMEELLLEKEDRLKLKQSHKTKRPFEIEVSSVRGDGSRCWINILSAPVQDNTGNFTHWINLCRDVTEKRTQAEVLARIRNNNEALINGVEDFVWLVSPELKLMLANKSYHDFFGRLQGSEIQEGAEVLFNFLPEERLKHWEALYARVFNGEQVNETVVELEDVYSGSELHLIVTMNPVYGKNKEIIAAACYLKNITEVKRMQDEMAAIQVNRQKEIIQAIIQTQEMERNEIGTELHDNVNQILATSQLVLGLAKESDNGQEAWIDKANTYIKQAIDEIRRLSHRLSPATFLKSSFAEAARELTANLQLSRQCTFELVIDDLDEQEVPVEMQMHLYRILQEQVTNILKHAEASVVNIHVSCKDHEVQLSVRDNGKGFDTGEKKSGIGFENMRNRVQLYNGTIDVCSSPGNGCEIVAKLNM